MVKVGLWKQLLSRWGELVKGLPHISEEVEEEVVERSYPSSRTRKRMARVCKSNNSERKKIIHY